MCYKLIVIDGCYVTKLVEIATKSSLLIMFSKKNLFKSIRKILKSTIAEAVTRNCSIKKVFLEFSQNSQENKHLCQPESTTLLKKRLWDRSFPVDFANFLRTPFLTEHLRATASGICLL